MSGASEQALGCVYAAIDEANEDRPGLPPLERSLETPIQGPGTELDSLALINLLAALEEVVERDLGVTVVLTDERALERDPSPFESVRTLVGYLEELLGEGD